MQNAKTLQEDIIRSKTIANEIVRQSEAPDVSGGAIQDAEEKTQFLNSEMQYSQQLHSTLSKIKKVNQLLGQVDEARGERRVLDSLHLLERTSKVATVVCNRSSEYDSYDCFANTPQNHGPPLTKLVSANPAESYDY